MNMTLQGSLRSAALVVAGLLSMGVPGLAADKPRVHLISTGGTISGGPAGPLNAANLLDRAPEIAKIADMTFEDFSNIDSSRMTPELQLKLGKRVREILAKDKGLAASIFMFVPTAIQQPTPQVLQLTWSDDQTFTLTLQQLRDACPCANCKGETILGVYYPPLKLPMFTPGMYEIEAIVPVGNYAIQVRWRDGHHQWFIVGNSCGDCAKHRRRSERRMKTHEK